MSVDAETILISNGLNWKFTLKDYPNHSLVKIEAKHARAKALAVIHKPIPDNPAHTEVVGKKSQGVANHLRNSSTWVHLQPK